MLCVRSSLAASHCESSLFALELTEVVQTGKVPLQLEVRLHYRDVRDKRGSYALRWCPIVCKVFVRD